MNHRVGLLVPSSNTMMETDFFRGLRAETTLHTSRMYLADTTKAAESVMLDEHVMPAARDLGTAKPHLVVFGCTSAGALRGNDYDAELCARISASVGAPVVSTIGAVREAISGASVRHIGVITPYVDELNQKLRQSIESDGVDVVCIAGMGMTDNFSIATVTPEQICDFAVTRLAGIAVDMVFVSCTNLAGIAARSMLAGSLGVPVVTSNQLVLEAATRLLDTTIRPE